MLLIAFLRTASFVGCLPMIAVEDYIKADLLFIYRIIKLSKGDFFPARIDMKSLNAESTGR